jgi:hypothetical protein
MIESLESELAVLREQLDDYERGATRSADGCDAAAGRA